MEEGFLAKDGYEKRDCLLFVAGDYPDKDVAFDRDDLLTLVRNSATEIPVKVEHLPESVFDEALGVVTGLRVQGERLWGTLWQASETRAFLEKAGARHLSVSIDTPEMRLREVSFVRRPRIHEAQVFSEGKSVRFVISNAFAEEGEKRTMTSVRQLAEGLIATLRGFTGSEEAGSLEARFAETLEQERSQWREERAEQTIRDWKRQGRLRATERAERIARALLTQGTMGVVHFDGESVSLGRLFTQFMEENGPVVPMGEWIPGDRESATARSGSANARLMTLAMERARVEGISYGQAFAAVAAAQPELARAAREE